MNRAVFLDRDGVTNPLIYNRLTMEYESPHSLEDFGVYPFLLKSLRMLKSRGFYLFVVSNQPSYAKGKVSLETIKAIGESLREYVDQNGKLIDEYYYCYHHPYGIVPEYSFPCECRKPGTLFLKQAAKSFNLDLAECFFIGDRYLDIQCGKSVGMKTIKINNKNSQKDNQMEEPTVFAENLYEAAKLIISMM